MFSKRLSVRSAELLKTASIIAGNSGTSYTTAIHILAAISISEPCIEKALLLKHTKYGYRYIDDLIVQTADLSKTAASGVFIDSVINEAVEISEKLEQSMVEPLHILAALTFQKDAASLKLFSSASLERKALRKDIYSILGCSNRKTKDSISGDVYLKTGVKTAKSKMLEKYGTNLTDLAKTGKLDPVIARDNEIDAVITVLMRRRKNNACLVGEAGVGKSAVVEGLAIRIARREVPERLIGAKLYSIDISGIISGTKYRGDFEERFRTLLTEVSEESNIILFFDEMHSLSDAGSAEGAINAANILKPILARSGIKIIGATTEKEYAKHIRPDAALARRFTKIQVCEPSEQDAYLMISGTIKFYERFHGTTVTPEAIKTAITLSSKYISDRFLPDKAIDLIDEACASPINGHCITSDCIEKCLKEKLGISVTAEPISYKESVYNDVFGQRAAIESVCGMMDLAVSGLKDPKRPSASFIFCGPTGCGKTELCRSLAEHYLGSAKNMIRLDMSEYQESGSISKLIGSNAGYIGYGDGGVLTERVSKQPYSLIVFDEAEKAHRSIFTILLQILEEGELTDSSGRIVNFRNTVIVITTNLGSEVISDTRGILGFATELETNKKALVTKELEGFFSRELMGRIGDVVIFGKLDKQAYRRIAQKELHELANIIEKLGINIYCEKEVADYIADRAFSDPAGARAVRKIAEKEIKIPVSQKLLNKEIKSGSSISIKLDRTCHKIVFESVELCFLNDLGQYAGNKGSGNGGKDYLGDHVGSIVNEAVKEIE